jgi:hypothetical protein
MLLGFEIGQRWPEAVMHEWRSYFVPVPNYLKVYSPAGLLALRSSYLPRLPISVVADSGMIAAFVPDHSGGPAPGFHGIPY